jgi:hypothetical protein
MECYNAVGDIRAGKWAFALSRVANELRGSVLGYEDHLRRVIAKRGACEIAEEFRDPETGARQKMFSFVPKEVTDAKGIRQALDASVGVRHVVNQLDVVALDRPMESDGSLAEPHNAAVRQRDLPGNRTLLKKEFIVHPARVCLEQVEDEAAVERKVTLRVGEAGQLIVDREQVLKRPERNDDERELLLQIKGRHIAINQPDASLNVDRQARQLFAATA